MPAAERIVLWDEPAPARQLIGAGGLLRVVA